MTVTANSDALAAALSELLRAGYARDDAKHRLDLATQASKRPIPMRYEEAPELAEAYKKSNLAFISAQVRAHRMVGYDSLNWE